MTHSLSRYINLREDSFVEGIWYMEQVGVNVNDKRILGANRTWWEGVEIWQKRNQKYRLFAA